jgi:diaminopimelate epimerase
MRYSLMSGAGNLFVVVDGFSEGLLRDPAALARAMCAPIETCEPAGTDAGVEPRPDGLILVRPSRRGADCAMDIYNADGSRPETCGNGLRCAAKLAAEQGHVDRDSFTIETDAGIRDVRVERQDGWVVSARVQMGRARILSADEEFVVAADRLRGTIVDLGNPHCVLLVDDERKAPVANWGPAIARHSRFPAGTNVEFLARRDRALHLRVWERGVGETRACGSGACAAAVVAERHGLAAFPTRLELLGGTLEVDCDGGGNLTLTGPVEELRSDEWCGAPADGRR